MNKLSIITNAIIVGAIALLYVLHFNGKQTCNPAPAVSTSALSLANDTIDSGSYFPVAYINLDTLLLNYRLYNKLKAEHESKYRAAEGRFQGQAEALQRDAAQYQDRAQKGMMTRAEIQEKETELQDRQQRLTTLEQELSQELAVKEASIQKRIFDSLQNVLKTYNADGKYRMILNNAFGNSLLNADGVHNITDTVTVMLNNRSGIK